MQFRKGTKLMGITGCEFYKRLDTVGEPPGAEICVSHMPSLKAKKPHSNGFSGKQMRLLC